MLAPFEAPRLKIARARRHINELESTVNQYLAAEPFAIIVEDAALDLGVPHWAWTVRISMPVPSDLSTIIGDVVHNLRSALDLLANDLVRLNGQSTKSVYFPFADSERGLSEMIKSRHFDRAGSEAVKLLKSLGPWKGGNIGLRAIHDLDVKDKHQALIPSAQAFTLDLTGLVPKNADPESVKKLKSWGSKITHDGQVAVFLPAGWGLTLGTKVKANYALGLDIEGDLGSHELIRLLNEFARIVEGIVGEFERSIAKTAPNGD